MSAQVFSKIIEQKGWGAGETLCGCGSTLAFTERARLLLPKLVKKYKIKSLLDAGCGDWHWMSQVALGIPVIGVDVVESLISKNLRTYGGDFRVRDICADELPKTDAILCRAVLFHLSNKNIMRALGNFKRSGARLLLATTHPKITENMDILDGEWRRLNLCAAPFGLPEPRWMGADGPGDDGYLAVWRLA